MIQVKLEVAELVRLITSWFSEAICAHICQWNDCEWTGDVWQG